MSPTMAKSSLARGGMIHRGVTTIYQICTNSFLEVNLGESR
jgi:hypothetical protein